MTTITTMMMMMMMMIMMITMMIMMTMMKMMMMITGTRTTLKPAFREFFTMSPPCRQLSPTRTLKRPQRNRLQIACNKHIGRISRAIAGFLSDERCDLRNTAVLTPTTARHADT